MRRLLIGGTLLAALAWPAGASANHHACPVATSQNGQVVVQRYNCVDVLVPYPVGGPKSPAPCGANVSDPLPASLQPNFSTPIPPNLAGDYGDVIQLDPLAPYGPDLSMLRPNLGPCPPTGTGPPIGSWSPTSGFSLGLPSITDQLLRGTTVRYWFRYYIGTPVGELDGGGNS